MKFLFQKGLSSDSETIKHMVRGEIEILLIPNYEQTKYILIPKWKYNFSREITVLHHPMINISIRNSRKAKYYVSADIMQHELYHTTLSFSEPRIFMFNLINPLYSTFN